MTQPLEDAKAIAHLDWTLICQVQLVSFPFAREGDPGPQKEIEPQCDEKATLFVAYHSVSKCRDVRQFMCARHFRELFSDVPETHKVCPVCGATRLISAKQVFP